MTVNNGDIDLNSRKEASGLRLFYWLKGIQVFAGSNPATAQRLLAILPGPRFLHKLLNATRSGGEDVVFTRASARYKERVEIEAVEC